MNLYAIQPAWSPDEQRFVLAESDDEALQSAVFDAA